MLPCAADADESFQLRVGGLAIAAVAGVGHAACSGRGERCIV
jgi:hypothetical protein